jgi:alcohol dehydrogenase
MITTQRAPRQLIEGAGCVAAIGRVVSDITDRALVITDRIVVELEPFKVAIESMRAAGVHVEIFSDALPDVPLELVDRCVEKVRAVDPGVLVAIGGGSVIDLTKATAVLHAHGGSLRDYYGENLVPGPVMPLVAVPTTAGTGAEVTTVAILSDPDRALKIGISSVHIIPNFSLCDPDLTMTCPPSVTAHSGIDALCHAIESFTAVRRESDWRSVVEGVSVGKNPVSDRLALEAVRLLSDNLPRAVEAGGDRDVRAAVMRGATIAGMAFAHSGVGAPHALQYPMGAATHTPHGLGVGLFLPYVLTANRAFIVEELDQLATVLGLSSGSDVVGWVSEFNARIGIPHELRSLGVERDQLRGLAEATTTVTRLLRNDRGPSTVESLEMILIAAWEGDLSLLA